MSNDEKPREPGGSGGELATKAQCPQCGRPAVPAFRPFCSKRCADIDLSRWLIGVYAVPGRPAEDEDDTDAGAG